MALFICHWGAHFLSTICYIFILPKTVNVGFVKNHLFLASLAWTLCSTQHRFSFTQFIEFPSRKTSIFPSGMSPKIIFVFGTQSFFLSPVFPTLTYTLLFFWILSVPTGSVFPGVFPSFAPHLSRLSTPNLTLQYSHNVSGLTFLPNTSQSIFASLAYEYSLTFSSSHCFSALLYGFTDIVPDHFFNACAFQLALAY